MNRSKLLLLTAVVLVIPARVSFSAPRERDVWYVRLYEETPYGYAHVVVEKLPDGNFRYLIDEESLHSNGTLKDKRTHHWEYVMTADYRPLSFESEHQYTTSRLDVRGHVKDGELQLTVSRSGSSHTRIVELADNMIFSISLDDWINDLPVDIRNASVKLFNRWYLVPETVHLSRRPNEGSCSGWEVDFDGFAKTIGIYDEKGISVETRYISSGTRTKRCSPEEARDIVHLDRGREYYFIFPVGKHISAPHRLTEMTVKLTWKDIPKDSLNLEDSRQRMVRVSEREGQYEAILKMTPPDLATTESIHPINKDEFAAELQETPFIKPNDSKIVSLARQVAKNKKTSLEVVRGLSQWVCENVTRVYCGGLLTATEILECKEGRNIEVAALFASLARSQGIPTRIVRGLKIQGSYWRPYVWNEVYVGQWIPVDAQYDELGGSPALLKLAHGDDVVHMGRVVSSLRGNIDISLQEFQIGESPLHKIFTTGIEGSIYTNVDYECRLTAPEDDWVIWDKSAKSKMYVLFEDPKIKMHLCLRGFAVPEKTPLKEIVSSWTNTGKMTYPDFQVLEDRPYEVAGVEGWTQTTTLTPLTGKDRKIAVTRVIWKRGAICYTVQLTVEESQYETVIQRCQELISSFEFLDETTPRIKGADMF